MGSAAESGWVLTLSLAAKCGGVIAADPSRLLVAALLFLLAYAAAVLLYWAIPGGPAWGKYRLTLYKRLGRPPGQSEFAAIPGPRGLPIVGSMGLMTGLAHRKLAGAAAACHAERLMAFSIGDTRAVVTAHPDVAREILSGPAFADRPVKESAYGLMFHRAIGFAPYGPYWRGLRRVAAAHLFSPKQLTASAAQRGAIAAQMVSALQQNRNKLGGCHHTIEVRGVLKRAALHNVMWSVFGKKYELELGGVESAEAEELRLLVEEGYDILGQLNWSDHLPVLAPFDPRRIRIRCSRLVPRVNRFVNRIIQERRAGRAASHADAPTAFVDVLLSLQGSERLTDPDIVAVLWEMIFRGTDTVAVLIEWALARLVLDRDVQARAHEELDRVVGRAQAVAEPDLAALPYLHAVLKEALRLHPPGPLLSWARLATSDVRVDGRLVPAGTTAMVNMWAITHDPAVWPDPLEFRPDRFVSDPLPALFGSDPRLAPFGAGRRSCPGKPLAMATAGLWVAALLQEFEFLPPSDGARVDLSEVLRLSCEMASPLAVRLRLRRTLA